MDRGCETSWGLIIEIFLGALEMQCVYTQIFNLVLPLILTDHLRNENNKLDFIKNTSSENLLCVQLHHQFHEISILLKGEGRYVRHKMQVGVD